MSSILRLPTSVLRLPVSALAVFAVQAVVVIVVFLAQMLWIALQLLALFLCWLLPILWEGCERLGQGLTDAAHGHKRNKLMPAAETLSSDPKISAMASPDLENALERIITAGGRGNPLDPPLNQILESIATETAADRVRILLLAIATAHREKANESALVPLYLRMDDQCLQDGGRTRLQELLLEDYSAINRLKLKAE